MNNNIDILTSDIVDENSNNIRIDKFLSLNFPDITRSRIKKLFEDGNITLIDDSKIKSLSSKTKTGEQYKIVIPEPIEDRPIQQDIKLDIIYEDDDLIVVNKPAGMTVHPAPGFYTDTLVNALLYHCRDNLSGINGVKRPGIVHRIDKDTSGLLVVAKNDKSHNFLAKQFEEHSVERVYNAICWGRVNPMESRIETNIARSKFDRKKMAAVQAGGKRAVTNYKTLEIYGKSHASLVECRLETGRTHQIRVHMSHIGNPLIGDPMYSSLKRKYTNGIDEYILKYIKLFNRQALVAKTLGFIHPTSKEKMHFETDFPNDFKELINRLNKI